MTSPQPERHYELVETDEEFIIFDLDTEESIEIFYKGTSLLCDDYQFRTILHAHIGKLEKIYAYEKAYVEILDILTDFPNKTIGEILNELNDD